MPIRFIPNDPLAGPGAPGMREVKPRPNRPAARAGFRLHDTAPQRLYDRGTPEFLFWQCREAAHAAVATWERHAGPLRTWQPGRTVDLWQDATRQRKLGPDLNAYYDRAGFNFFEYDDRRGKVTLSGESTDVVAHEVGHGLLDAVRADLWDSTYLEVNAFHEAFGDCMALLTALDDAESAAALLAANPARPNFLETLAEDLSDSIRRLMPKHNAAEPRHALNALRWQLPSTLPASGGPGVLLNESHSFSRVFTGCFYDLVRNLLGTAKTAAALDAATATAASLLVEGARNAPETPRFMQAVGRAMTLADERANGGKNRTALRDAFAGHGIALGTDAMLAPVVGLEGAEPRVAARSAVVATTSLRDLRERLGAEPDARITVRPRLVFGDGVAEATHVRVVSLGELSPRLRGVVALAPESVLVGGSGRRAAVLGALPHATTTVDEVHSYVTSLLENDRVQLGAAPRRAAKDGAPTRWKTHAVRVERGRRVLTRIRFVCP